MVLLLAETHVVGGRDHFHWTPWFVLNQPKQSRRANAKGGGLARGQGSTQPRSAAQGGLGGGRFSLFPHFLSRASVTLRQQREKAALGEMKWLGVTVKAHGAPGKDRRLCFCPFGWSPHLSPRPEDSWLKGVSP